MARMQSARRGYCSFLLMTSLILIPSSATFIQLTRIQSGRIAIAKSQGRVYGGHGWDCERLDNRHWCRSLALSAVNEPECEKSVLGKSWSLARHVPNPSLTLSARLCYEIFAICFFSFFNWWPRCAYPFIDFLGIKRICFRILQFYGCLTNLQRLKEIWNSWSAGKKRSKSEASNDHATC